jgi:probable rRNA maturation factor
LLRRIAKALLEDVLDQTDFELGIYVLGSREMTSLNEGFLHHQGVTDVIAFDYSEPEPKSSRWSSPSRRAEAPMPLRLWGEICVCLDEATRQARRFHTTWQSELVRYVVHGVLHLRGYNDQKAAARRQMKREEDRLLAALAARFGFGGLRRTKRKRRKRQKQRRQALRLRKHRSMPTLAE